MRPIVLLLAAAFLVAGCGDPADPDLATRPDLTAAGDRTGNVQAVIQVAKPTGNPIKDVANIEAAVERATPGALIQFAEGTYRITQSTRIIVSAPGVTLQGHPEGTTIRGVSGESLFFLGQFRLLGGNQTVRHLHFHGFTAALTIGDPGQPNGGYRVEHSTFRLGNVGINFAAFSDDVSTIRNNRFIDVTLPFVILGKTVHFTNNRVTTPHPSNMVFGQPFNAGIVAPDPFFRVCENNVLEGNTVVGNADGFILAADFEGELCRNNIVRGNIFRDQRVFTEFDNGTMAFLGGRGAEQNLIEGNQLQGSEGVGLWIDGRRNRILGNKFSGLPGTKAIPNPFPGTAVFLSETSRGNRVLDNEFRDVVRRVKDLGTNNVVPGSQALVAGAEHVDPNHRSRASDNWKLQLLRKWTRP
jgi:parallel beta-helix repeat protein